MRTIKVLFALLKREILEHRSIWFVPLVLLAIGVLIRVSTSAGNLAIDFNAPDFLGVEDNIDSAINSALPKVLSGMNSMVVMVMMIVSIFYALSCLYSERQDESVLFWRSLPISDSLTVASKLITALLLIPVLIVICQLLMTVVFLDVNSFAYLSQWLTSSVPSVARVVLWSMLPTIAWCTLCSAIAKKNPFLLAFIAPLLVALVDSLFLNGQVSDTLIINRLWGVSEYSVVVLVSGVVFSIVCIVVAIIKRSQRI